MSENESAISITDDARFIAANRRFEERMRAAYLLPVNARRAAVAAANRSLRASVAAIRRWK